MYLSKRQWFEVRDVVRGTAIYKRLEEMNRVEVLMAANQFADSNPELSAALFGWQSRMSQRRTPQNAA